MFNQIQNCGHRADAELREGTTGAANDLSGATELAIKMFRERRLSPLLGPIGYESDGRRTWVRPNSARNILMLMAHSRSSTKR
jgi:ATP-dependent Zn protease